MCGFPISQLDKYLKILVQQHKLSVALCEEFQRTQNNPDEPKSFDRRVVRVLTPGTLIDESFINPYENNFLLAISLDEDTVETDSSVGLAWIDLSTGEFFARSVKFTSLRDELARIDPREIVLHDAIQNCSNRLFHFMDEQRYPVSYVACPEKRTKNQTYESQVGEVTIDEVLSSDPVDPIFSPDESSAIDLLNAFIRANLLERAPSSLVPARDVAQRRMQIDAQTLKALEIRE